MENRLADTAGEGEGGMNGESSLETFTLSYVKQISFSFFLSFFLFFFFCCMTQGTQPHVL